MSEAAFKPPGRLDTLLALWSDQRLTDAEWIELRSILSTDPAAADRYLDYVKLHALLEVELEWQGAIQNHSVDLLQEISRASTPLSLSDAMILPAIHDEYDDDESLVARTLATSPVPSAVAKDPARKTRVFRRVFLLAASLLIVSAIAMIVTHLMMSHRSQALDVAILTGAIDAKWSEDSGQWTAGSVLPAQQKLSLDSGWAELAYPSGIVVAVEGPSRFSIEAGRVLALESGKVTAYVPQAGHGFTVRTPSAVVVDLGTEFGVSCGRDGKSNVEVFKGKVTLAPITGPEGQETTGTPLQLSAGDTRQVGTDGVIAPIQLAEATFVRPQQFTAWVQADRATPYERWVAFSERLRRDPTLVAYYTFENQNSAPGRLVNYSMIGSSLDGVLGGGDPEAVPAWTTGRWTAKGAMQFRSGENQHVAIPGLPALNFSRGEQNAVPFSIAVWVKGVGDQDSAIVTRGRAAGEQYAFGPQPEHFRIWVRDQQPAVRSGTDFDLSCGSDTDGRWHGVVATYDPANLKITLYVDGKECAAMKAPAKLLDTSDEVRIGSRQILPGDSPANLEGSIDEVAIFRRALTADEVHAMYEAGKPD